MPIQPKYDIERQQKLLDQLMDVFVNDQTPADLALMTLGNAVTNVIKQLPKQQDSYQIAEQFGKVLLQSLDK